MASVSNAISFVHLLRPNYQGLLWETFLDTHPMWNPESSLNSHSTVLLSRYCSCLPEGMGTAESGAQSRSGLREACPFPLCSHCRCKWSGTGMHPVMSGHHGSCCPTAPPFLALVLTLWPQIPTTSGSFQPSGRDMEG